MRRDGFVALVGPNALAERAPTSDLEQRLRLSHTQQFPDLHFDGARIGDALLLPDGLGIVWGRLFDRSGNPVRTVSPDTARDWISSGGRDLVATFWGSYIALLVGEDHLLAIRDPSGAAPCYYASTAGGVVLASDAERARSAAALPVAIDWTEIRSELQHIGRRTARTALAGFSELLPGTALRISEREARVATLWSPYQFVGGWRAPSDFGDAAHKVREVVAQTVRALTSDCVRPLSEVSGGVDSSIVTAALSLAGRNARCVTVRGGDSDLDERPYAKAVAVRCGFAWKQVVLDVDDVDIRRSDAFALPRPSARAFSQAVDEASLLAAREMGCDAFVSGGGGDNVFWYFQNVLPALDRLRCQGVGGFLATVHDLAWMSGVSRAEALRLSIRRLFRRAPRPWPHDISLLAPEACSIEPMPLHPWLPAPSGTVPGVQAYARLLVLMQGQYEAARRAEAGTILAPLLAQPVIETCLAIPSWFWCREGRNRAVARAAFADLLPSEILARRSKGGFDGFAYAVFLRNRVLVREMLLDGALAQQGLLDRPEVERLLSGSAEESNLLANRLLRLVSIEAWLASWSGRLG
ncbi:asparagine synthetase B family protein [Tsuneonella suprasediminis]|uniref:asparagine synthetase B family protein n=1 Tax=Tsuneonella suprasediminis TaxID=2306996 RepID=UPI002F91C3E2